jgi:signal transduction histidine kinase
MTPPADQRGVAILADLGDMPAIAADADGLHQAVLNLLSNALDAVPDQTGAVTIGSSYNGMDRTVQISIVDNGPGIGYDVQKRIFEPFFSTKGQKGTGLGLAVTRKIVLEHGGDITVKSTPGHGATFTITLSSLADNEQPSDQTRGPGL